MRTSSPWIAFALAALVGCGNHNKQQPPPDVNPGSGSASGSGSGSSAVQDETPKSDRQIRAEAALAKLPEVKEKLAKLRGLEFTEDVPGLYQSQEDFEHFVSGEVEKDLPEDKAAAIADAMLHIGLLTDPIDLRKTLSNAVASQAAAYYDPKQKKFFVVMVPGEDMGFDLISSHELTHALQDQHFGLDKYLEPDGKELDDDSANARKFIVEGEATLTMFAYLLGQQSGQDMMAPANLPKLRLGLGLFANMTVDDFKKQSQGNANPEDKDNDIQKAIAAMDDIPLVILQPMMDSYLKGAVAVSAVYMTGGWDAVNALYTTPPDSTEQLLHPDKLVPKRDVPQKVTLPTLPGYTEVFSNTMGELEWRIYFMLWRKDVAEKTAEGWDGDRWSVVKDKDGNEVGILATVWDDAKEAKEFSKEYQATVKKRFPKHEREVYVKVKGNNVYIVDGGTDAKLIDAVIKGTTIQ